MHIITRPIIVNGKRIGPNKAMQAISAPFGGHDVACDCDQCETLLAMLDTHANAIENLENNS